MTVKLVPIESIVVPPNRQRREFNPERLTDLMDSISRSGLLHPLVVREESGKYLLAAGERRLRALTDLQVMGGTLRFAGGSLAPGQIPVISVGSLTLLEAEEVELEENIRREDLTWQEKAAAMERLAHLRAAQAAAVGAAAPTHNDLAEELYDRRDAGPAATVHKQLVVARNLDNPEVAKAKTLDEAFKVLKRQESAARNIELAQRVGETFHVGLHTIKNEDAETWIAACPDGVFDVVCTDPPYGMGADGFGDSGGRATGAHDYSDGPEVWARILQWAPAQLFRVTRPQAHLYMFCDIDGFFAMREALAAAGWRVHRTPLIWHKPNGQRAPWPEHGPQRKWEMILYAVKGNKPVTKVMPDLITCPSDENLGHNAQKPVALLEDLLRRSVKPGDHVLDCFAGSGSTLVAAHGLKCIATLVEKSTTHYGTILKRAAALKEVA